MEQLVTAFTSQGPINLYEWNIMWKAPVWLPEPRKPEQSTKALVMATTDLKTQKERTAHHTLKLVLSSRVKCCWLWQERRVFPPENRSYKLKACPGITRRKGLKDTQLASDPQHQPINKYQSTDRVEALPSYHWGNPPWIPDCYKDLREQWFSTFLGMTL